MDIKQVKLLPYDELRAAYKEYLKSCGLASNTVKTSYNETFYLWNKSGREIFWKVIDDDNFEESARKALMSALVENTKGNPRKLLSGYMSHLRRFRKFLLTDGVIPVNINAVKNIKRRKSSFILPEPCEEQAEHYLKQWNSLENYHLQENALDKLFFDLCPENKSISDILLKTATLNDFYSTNIYSVYPVAKHILKLNIDERLQTGDVTLVDDIKAVEINGKPHNFYSFATKYCSHHKPLDYPIYDSYVEKTLIHFRKQDCFAEFTTDDLRNYARFKDVILSFKEFYKLEDYTLKEIDRYLWQLGKEYFLINYGGKKEER